MGDFALEDLSALPDDDDMSNVFGLDQHIPFDENDDFGLNLPSPSFIMSCMNDDIDGNDSDAESIESFELLETDGGSPNQNSVLGKRNSSAIERNDDEDGDDVQQETTMGSDTEDEEPSNEAPQEVNTLPRTISVMTTEQPPSVPNSRRRPMRKSSTNQYHVSECNHRDREFVLNTELEPLVLSNVDVQTSIYQQAFCCTDILFINSKIERRDVTLEESSCLLCNRSHCTCTMGDFFETGLVKGKRTFLFETNVFSSIQWSDSIFQNYYKAMSHESCFVSGITKNHEAFRLMLDKYVTPGHTYVLLQLASNSIKQCNVRIESCTERFLQSGFCACVPVIDDTMNMTVEYTEDVPHRVCNVDPATEFCRKLFRHGTSPKKQNRHRGRSLFDLETLNEQRVAFDRKRIRNLKKNDEDTVVLIDSLPENILEASLTRGDVGVYVNPQRHLAYENSYCYNEMSFRNGLFLPHCVKHESKYPMLKWFVRIYCPSMIITMSTFMKNAVDSHFADPGIPFLSIDGNKIEGRLSRNFERANHGFQTSTISNTNQQKTKALKLMIATGRLTIEQGLIGIRNRLSNVTAIVCSNVEEEGGLFDWNYRPPGIKVKKKTVPPTIDMHKFFRAVCVLFRYNILCINETCFYCSDQPSEVEEVLNESWGSLSNDKYSMLRRIGGESKEKIQRTHDWVFGGERFNACGGHKDVCIDCALMFVIKESLEIPPTGRAAQISRRV